MKILLWLISIIPITIGAFNAHALTIKEATALALKESPSLLASSEKTEASKAEIKRVEGMLLPQFNASETYIRSDDPVIVFGGKLQQGKFTQADFNLSNLNHPNGINNWITRIEVNQPIIHSGVTWAQRRGAIAAHQSQQHMESFDHSRVEFAVSQLYYSAVALAEQSDAMSRGIRRLRSLEHSYELIEAPTSASTTSYLVARSVRTNMESEVVRFDSHAKAAARELNIIMGREPDVPISFEDPLPSIKSLNAGVGQSEYVRSDVMAMQNQTEAAKAARDAALRRWGPDLDFFGAYNVYSGDFKSAEGSYEVGARLSLPLFNWSNHANTKKTEAEWKASQHMLRATELKASADLETAKSNLLSCIERYHMVNKATSIASEALDVATQRYDEGTLPLMDYSQAIQNWVQMKVQLLDNHLRATLARANYEFQRGEVNQ